MTPPTAPERCPTCDRDYCNRWLWSRRCAQAPTQAHFDECAAHRVDWRARAIAAESAAAQWAKVAPLIERLRHTRRHTKPEFVVAAIDALLAATEATP